jgi:hypothetical protein
MGRISTQTITLQRQTKAGTTLYECTVEDAVGPIMFRSCHGSSLLAFCEGLLGSGGDEGGSDDDDDDYSGKSVLPAQPPNLNWLECFPARYRPTDCVVMAGEGATSTLHRDPYEWTGTSLCLEGTKLWRFLRPAAAAADDDEMDRSLRAYRLPSMAWSNAKDGDNDDDDDDDEDGRVALSAGWQSDYSLYGHRCESIPSGRELSRLTDTERLQLLDDIALNSSLPLRPDTDEAGNMVVPHCECWTAIQKPGDLLLIPAYWWHQTYALEPSLAVASQRCSSRYDAKRVIRHMLSTTGTVEAAPDVLLRDDYSNYTDEASIRNIVNALFDHLEKSLSTTEQRKT